MTLTVGADTAVLAGLVALALVFLGAAIEYLIHSIRRH
jgi:hypothetical protein